MDSQVPALKPCRDGGNPLFNIQSVKTDIELLVCRVDITAVTGPVLVAGDYPLTLLLVSHSRVKDTYYIYPELLCKFKVALVVSRHCHDGACSVTHKHVVSHPYRYFLVVDRVDGVCSGKDTGFVPGQVSAVKIRLQGGCFHI